MSGRFVVAVDQGTSSTRCIVYDRRGVMVSVAQLRQRIWHPAPGWVEQDAAEIWRQTQRVISEAMASAGLTAADVVGLGVTNQRETVVVWDADTGRPVHRAITWQDTRTTGIVDAIRARPDAADLARRAGLPIANYVSAPRLRWILDRLGAERPKRLLVGTMDSWLVWNLTGGRSGGRHVTDSTNASRTLLMNIETEEWDDVLLAASGIDRASLPRIVASMGEHGAVAGGPLAGVPIRAVMGDQQAALVGQVALRAGESKFTLGTGGFLVYNTGTELVRSNNGLVTTIAYRREGESPRYALEGTIPTAGSLVEWVRTTLGLISAAPEIETLAETVGDNGGCLIIPAFSGLHAPRWASESRGAIVGLTAHVTRGHLARAVLETMAYQSATLLDVLVEDLAAAGGADRLERLVVDGGMTANNLLMQMMADYCGVPVIRPRMAESVALGAAYCAGMTAGLWTDEAQLRANWRAAARWEPRIPDEKRRADLSAWQQAVDAVGGWSFGR